MDQIIDIISNPMFSSLLTFVLGWVGLPQPSIVALWWGRIMGVASAMKKAEVLLMQVDAILKQKGIVPPDSPTLTVDKVSAMAKVDVSQLVQVPKK